MWELILKWWVISMSKDKIKCSKEVENENISGGCCPRRGKFVPYHGIYRRHKFDFHKGMMPPPPSTSVEINCSNSETSNDEFKSVVTDGASVSSDDSNSTKP